MNSIKLMPLAAASGLLVAALACCGGAPQDYGVMSAQAPDGTECLRSNASCHEDDDCCSGECLTEDFGAARRCSR